MALPNLLTGLFSGTESASADSTQDGASVDSTPSVVHECRNCGLTVNARTTRCPSCSHDQIVDYPVD